MQKSFICYPSSSPLYAANNPIKSLFKAAKKGQKQVEKVADDVDDYQAKLLEANKAKLAQLTGSSDSYDAFSDYLVATCSANFEDLSDEEILAEYEIFGSLSCY